MQLKIKKFVYLVNDITNLLLKKDIEQRADIADKLRLALIFISIVLLLSVILNFYLYFR